MDVLKFNDKSEILLSTDSNQYNSLEIDPGKYKELVISE